MEHTFETKFIPNDLRIQPSVRGPIKSLTITFQPDGYSATLTPDFSEPEPEAEAPFSPGDHVEVQRPAPDTYVAQRGDPPHTVLCCFECRGLICWRRVCPDSEHGPQSCHAHHGKTYVWTEL